MLDCAATAALGLPVGAAVAAWGAITVAANATPAQIRRIFILVPSVLPTICGERPQHGASKVFCNWKSEDGECCFAIASGSFTSSSSKPDEGSLLRHTGQRIDRDWLSHPAG